MPKSKVRKKHPQQQRPAAQPEYQRDHRYQRDSDQSKSAQFDTQLTSTFTLRWTLLVTVAAICATVILAVVFGAKERGLQAFENAPVCASGQSVGCLVDIPVTIQDRGQGGSSKDPTYYLDLDGAAPADGQVDLPGQTALWNSVTAGDSATATIWNGRLVRVEDNNVEGDTSQAPGVQMVLVQALLISSVIWILTSAMFSARIAQSNQGRPDGWTRGLVPFQMPALLAALFFPIGALIGQQSESLTVAVAIGAGLTAAASAYLIFDSLRNR